MKPLKDSHRRKLFHALDRTVDSILSDESPLLMCVYFACEEIDSAIQLAAFLPGPMVWIAVAYLMGVIRGIIIYYKHENND